MQLQNAPEKVDSGFLDQDDRQKTQRFIRKIDLSEYQ